MPPSQLKRLKTSLREQGITGPQKSKKQKKQASRDGAFRDIRIHRNIALEGIREQFNPFEIRHLARPSKHDVTSSKIVAGKDANGAVTKPGTTKGFGEEQVRLCPLELYEEMLTRDSRSVVRPCSRRCKGERRLEGSLIEDLEKMTLP